MPLIPPFKVKQGSPGNPVPLEYRASGSPHLGPLTAELYLKVETSTETVPTLVAPASCPAFWPSGYSETPCTRPSFFPSIITLATILNGFAKTRVAPLSLQSTVYEVLFTYVLYLLRAATSLAGGRAGVRIPIFQMERGG